MAIRNKAREAGASVLFLACETGAALVAERLGFSFVTLLALVGVAILVWGWWPDLRALGGKRRMIPLIGMIVCGIGFFGFAGWHFWPVQIPMVVPTTDTEASPTQDEASIKVVEAPLTLAKNPDGSDRTFVSVSPYDLMSFYKKNTSAQAQQLVQPYLRNWIALSGVVYDVKKNSDDIMIQPGTSALSIIMSGGDIQMHFDPSEAGNAEAALLIRGSKFSAVCRIDDIQEVGVALAKCRLFH
jgi:hypothetical protein